MSKKYLLEILENNKPILQPTAASIQFLLSYSKAMDVKKFKKQRMQKMLNQKYTKHFQLIKELNQII